MNWFSFLGFHADTPEFSMCKYTICSPCVSYCTHEYMTHTYTAFHVSFFIRAHMRTFFCSHSCMHEHAAHIYFGFHSWLSIHEHMNTRRTHPGFHTCTHEYITSQPCCATHAYIQGRELACSTNCVSRVHRLCVIFIHAHMNTQRAHFWILHTHTHTKNSFPSLFFMHVHT